MANEINAYSMKWMSAPLSVISFMRLVTNIWSLEYHPPYGGEPIVQQTWCPEKINIQTGRYSIHWRLVSATYYNNDESIASGKDTTDDIPFSSDGGAVLKIETSLRAILKKRIRRYRMRATFYQMRLEELTKRYYKRYGITEHTDNDSVLSNDTSDSE